MVTKEAVFSQLPDGETTLVDLSIGIVSEAASEPFPPTVEFHDHREGAEILVANLRESGISDIEADDFPDGLGLAWEEVTAITHTGTHLDAPWHYGPEADGAPARTIDQVPLEWCVGDAVVLDFTWKGPRTEISDEEVRTQLDAVGHTVSEGDIVLIETGADEHWGTVDYLTEFPGLSGQATRYLVERGTRVIGTDAYGLDKPFVTMGERFSATGDSGELWPAHLAGRNGEYCQIEKMANLDALPRRTEVPIVAFPVNIPGASAGWVRPVAFLEGAE